MKVFKISFCFIISLICLTCGSWNGIIWDESVPLEQSSKIAFFFFIPRSYNQISADKKDLRIVTIPSGVSIFSGDVDFYESGPEEGNPVTGYRRIYYILKTENVSFSCKLEAGKEYWAIVGHEDNNDKKNLIWGIKLYEEKIQTRVGNLPKETFIGFIPFDPPVYTSYF